jgi:prepilin-type N-terminal cleavage/methylation domain-containing protein
MGPTGYTLLEILVAVVLTSLVALIAYGALHVSLGTRERLGVAMADEQRSRMTRELLVDVFRNMRTPQRQGDTTFTLGGDTLMVVAAGGGPPLDADCDWRVTIRPDAGGLRFIATPVGRSPMAQVAFRLPGVTRMEVRVLAPTGSEWLDRWPPAGVTPRAIAVTLWNRSLRVDPSVRVVF